MQLFKIIDLMSTSDVGAIFLLVPTAAGVHGEREGYHGRGPGSGSATSQPSLPLLRAGDHRRWREVLHRPGSGTQGESRCLTSIQRLIHCTRSVFY